MTHVRRGLVAAGAGICTVGAHGLATRAHWPAWAAVLAGVAGLVGFLVLLRITRPRVARRVERDRAEGVAALLRAIRETPWKVHGLGRAPSPQSESDSEASA